MIKKIMLWCGRVATGGGIFGAIFSVFAWAAIKEASHGLASTPCALIMAGIGVVMTVVGFMLLAIGGEFNED